MPTPVAHAIGGLAAAFFTNSAARRAGLSPRLLIAAVAVAVAPDLDLLIGTHRTYTHSLGGVAIVGLAGWLLLRRRASNAPAAAAAITAAHGSHLLLDWLGKDPSNPPGLMILWPFSSTFFISGYGVFDAVSRRYWLPEQFIVGNLKSLGWELVVLLPMLLVAWIFWSGKTVQSPESKVQGRESKV